VPITGTGCQHPEQVNKYELFTVIAIIAILSVCSAGIGMSPVAMVQIGDVKTGLRL